MLIGVLAFSLWPVGGYGEGALWDAKRRADTLIQSVQDEVAKQQAELQAAEATKVVERRAERQTELIALERQVAELTNAERASHGLPSLRYDLAIAEIARSHSDNMLARRALEHRLDGKGPTDRALANGYNCRRNLGGGKYEYGLSENIHYSSGYGKSKVAEQIVDGWMQSPGHRKNILDLHATRIGVGIAYAGSTWYATQNFSTCR